MNTHSWKYSFLIILTTHIVVNQSDRFYFVDMVFKEKNKLYI